MKPLYEPAPEQTPWYSRRLGGTRGLTWPAFLALVVLGVPAIYLACLGLTLLAAL